MSVRKYIDKSKEDPFTFDSNKYVSCNHNTCISEHNKGFYTFLSTQKISDLDEYKDGDPFGMESNLESHFQTSRKKITLELVFKSLKSNDEQKRVLDVGCGQGYITAEIKKTFPNFAVSGMDISLSAIAYANSKFPNIDFAVADIFAPPYSKKYFDIIVINNIWEHVSDPLGMLNNISAILKPDGVVIMSTPSRYRIMNLIKALLGKQVSISNHHITEYSIGQVKEQFRFCGFSINTIKSQSLKNQGGSFITRLIVYRFLKPIFSFWLRLFGSHHSLESTVFYLAQKNN